MKLEFFTVEESWELKLWSLYFFQQAINDPKFKYSCVNWQET